MWYDYTKITSWLRRTSQLVVKKEPLGVSSTKRFKRSDGIPWDTEPYDGDRASVSCSPPAVKNTEKETIRMTTPGKIRSDAAKLDAYLEAFEHTYLHFLDVGDAEQEQRDRGTFAFYEIRDKVTALMAEMDEFAGHMEVCNAIFACDQVRKGGAV